MYNDILGETVSKCWQQSNVFDLLSPSANATVGVMDLYNYQLAQPTFKVYGTPNPASTINCTWDRGQALFTCENVSGIVC